jgi:hypothetical protein
MQSETRLTEQAFAIGDFIPAYPLVQDALRFVHHSRLQPHGERIFGQSIPQFSFRRLGKPQTRVRCFRQIAHRDRHSRKPDRRHFQHAQLTEQPFEFFPGSQIIDPHGHVHARLDALQQGPLIGTILPENKLTFYTRFGWLMPWIVLLAAVVWWFALLLPKGPEQLGDKHE